MNIPLLIQIQAQIIQHPEHFDMATWDCGSVACICGWAIRLTRGESMQWCGPYFHEGRRALGLTCEEGNRLFHRKNWPRQFCVMSGTEKAHAKAAAARIDHFIATEGRE